MHASSKLRSLRKFKSRDHQATASSPTMHAASRRDIQLSTKHAYRGSAPTTSSTSSTTAWGDSSETAATAVDTPRFKWRRNSSAEIPIPSFMIPCSASSLMNTRYALSSDAATANYAPAISQR